MRASTELDNLIDAGTNFRNKPDGVYGHMHEDAIGGFSYFDVIFKVADEYYYGLINIKNNTNGWLLKDITQIRNITDDVTASYGKNPASSVVSDAQAEQSATLDTTSDSSRLSQNQKSVNRNFSLKETGDIGTKDWKELLDIIEHLKGKFETTKFPKADPKKLAKMTRELLEEYSSLTNFDETFSAKKR